MRVTNQSDCYCVCDDMLDREALAALWEYVRGVKLTGAHAEQYERVFGFDDGTPYFGQSIVAYVDSARRNEQDENQFPTRTAIDAVFRALFRRSARFRPWIGTKGKDWVAIVARVAVYPAGTGLSWHDDANVFSGAFSFFIHPNWEFDWGGELMVLDGPPLPQLKRSIPPRNRPADPLRGRCLVAEDYTRSHGSFVVPRPNRLVAMKSGVTHSINPVRRAAGRVPRLAVSGFFVRSESLR